MEGTVSSLVPQIAAALATKESKTAFLVGLATAVAAGIRMALSEALYDYGKLSGRWSPWLRSIVEECMTLLGAIGHALTFLIHKFEMALLVASFVVGSELIAIAYKRNIYMDTRFCRLLFR